jgi:Tol biopolymer transport system component
VPLARSGLIGSLFLPANAIDAQWSPDGKWIAFVEPGAQPKLELVSTSGGRPTVLVPRLEDSLLSFSWSPASNRIAYAAPARRGKLVTVDLYGKQTLVSGSVNWVSDDGSDWPQWSPDGTKLVFMGLIGPNVAGRPPAGVWIVDTDGTNLKRLA